MADKQIEYERWKAWFNGVSGIEAHFDKWRELNSSVEGLETIFGSSALPLSLAIENLQRAKQKLNYAVPYKLIVFGQTGSGKSTLINAIIGSNLLETGDGASITGVATYVYLGAEDERGLVKVVYRTEEEFLNLINKMLASFGLPQLTSMDQASNTVMNDDLGPILLAAKLSEGDRNQLTFDLKDITHTWNELKKTMRIGQSQDFDMEKDGAKLKEIMDEHSSYNQPGSATREIAGINRVEYYLPASRFAGEPKGWLPHAVLVDTPGIGARTFRHLEVLREQVEQADAVILVVGARRPEGQTISMTHLLKETLFRGYTPEERERFASKVFFVVNQIDVIDTTASRKRLNRSIDEIAGILTADYRSRYGESSPHRRYFETSAHRALYQAPVPGAHQPVSDESHVSEMVNKLQEFLGQRRLELVLDEAETLLKRATNEARHQSEETFRRNGIELNGNKDPETLRTRHRQQLCYVQLKQDYQALLRAYNDVRGALEDWRRSARYESALRQEIGRIDGSIREKLKKYLSELLNSEKGVINKAIDDVMGVDYVEGHVKALLLDLERKFRSEIEAEVRQLVQLYVDELTSQLKTHRLAALLKEKTYEQEYVLENLDPVNRVEEALRQLTEDYLRMSCWALLYELIQMPALARSGREESVVKKVARAVKEEIVTLFMESTTIRPELSEEPIELFSDAPGLTYRRESRVRILPPSLRFDAGPELISSPEDVWAISDEMLYVLERKIGEEPAGNAELEALMLNPFVARYQQAFSLSLPVLENLFFYLLGKFRIVFYNLAEELLAEHLAQIRANPNAVVIEILVSQQEKVKSEIEDAAHLLIQISQPSPKAGRALAG